MLSMSLEGVMFKDLLCMLSIGSGISCHRLSINLNSSGKLDTHTKVSVPVMYIAPVQHVLLKTACTKRGGKNPDLDLWPEDLRSALEVNS